MLSHLNTLIDNLSGHQTETAQSIITDPTTPPSAIILIVSPINYNSLDYLMLDFSLLFKERFSSGHCLA